MRTLKTTEFKLSDMLELALKELAAVKETATKCEYSCDALGNAVEKFSKKNNLPVNPFDNVFKRYVVQLWKDFAFEYMQANLSRCSLFSEFYQDAQETQFPTISTRESQQARVMFLTFGIMLLRENPERDNCTYSFY